MSKLCLSLVLLIVVSANGNLNQMMPPPPPQRPSCPSYTSQQNIDYSKLQGIWYDLAAIDPSFNDLKCAAINITNNSNNTVSIVGTPVRLDGTVMKNPFLFQKDPKTPGELFYSVPSQDRPNTQIRVQYSAIYTDYSDILVFYQCFNSQVGANMDAFVLVKSKSFDSLSRFLPAIFALARNGVDLNQMKFVANLNCTNV